jgi:GT2 family glycosyltransferase
MARAPSLVSVVIPCYSQAHFLAECLASVQAQTHSHWEAIVVDDASPDGALIRQIVQSLGDARVRLVRHPENRGLGAARNTGFGESRADFILPLDADDLLEPGALAALLAALEADERADCAYADVRLFGRLEGVVSFPGPPAGGKVKRREHTIPGAGTLTRRALWERTGGYDESAVLRHGQEDFEFWMRAFKGGCHAVRVPQPLYLYRHAHTSMHTAAYLHQHEISAYLYDKHRAVFDTRREGKAFLQDGFLVASRAWQQKGARRTALALALRAFALLPSTTALKEILRAALTPAQQRALQRGAHRRALPFARYPLHGTARHRPFFIIGAGRSGNTLLRRILTAHPDLHVPPETFVLGQVTAQFPRLGRMAWDDLVRFVLAQFEYHPEFHTFGISLRPLANRLANAPRERRNLADMLDALYRFHAQAAGKNPARWGDKTPLNSLDDRLARGDAPRRRGAGTPETLERLRKVFPDAQFIHIYRNGADAAYSHLQGGFYQDVRDAGARWLHVIRQARRFVRQYPRQCLEIRYEDLIAKPQETVQTLCAFLGVTYQPEMHTRADHAAGMGDVPEWSWHRQVADDINPHNAGKARFLSATDKAALQQIIGEELAALGYPPCTDE